jgi:hypothetical protein
MGLPWQARTYAHIKYESLIPSPDEEGLDTDSEPDFLQDREAKRRRVENYARQYLKGEPLFIASATLEGPFPPGWRNPWRKTGAVLPLGSAEVVIPALGEDAELEDSASDDGDAVIQHRARRTYNRTRKVREKVGTLLGKDRGMAPAVMEEGESLACILSISIPIPSIFPMIAIWSGHRSPVSI